LRYLVEPEPLGTAGAIKFAAPYLEERFFALNGDVLTDLDLTALWQSHERRKARLSLGLYPVDDPSNYGLVELDADGELVVTDYKTGRAPSSNFEQKSLAGVHFYSFLCEAVLGRRPAKIRLMYLASGETIETVPSAQSVKFITTRTTAVWSAVERACTTGDFRPRQSKLCDWCSFRQWCPAFGGDPSLAATEAVAAHDALIAAPA